MKRTLRKNDGFSHGDVTVRREGGRLELRNSRLRRVISLETGVPVTLSMETADGQPLAVANNGPDFNFIGLSLPGLAGARKCSVPAAPRVEVEAVPASWQDGEHVRVDVTMLETVQAVRFVRSYFLYPGLPVLAVQTSVRSAVSPNLYWTHRRKLPSDGSPEFLESCADSLRPADGIRPVRAVEFQGRTDYSNDLVFDRPISGNGTTATGNLLYCENETRGWFFLQEAPPSSERRDFEDHDFRITPDGAVRSCGWGIFPSDLAPGKTLRGYRHVFAWYPRGEEEATLKRYLRTRFPQNPDRDFSVTVNPWGVGCFPTVVGEDFLRADITAAAGLAATHYQIDDGWQAGRTLGELTTHNGALAPSFWEVSTETLPNGFEPLHRTAKETGIELALWVAPSFNREYRDARVLSERMLDFWKRFGMRMFKIDGVKTRTKESEDRLEALVAGLREQSNGEILFNFDTTNGQRPGYFLFLEYGNIFLENRYVCHEWGVGYHPESTLRNFWIISRYVRAQTLQIEVANPGAIRKPYYERTGRTSPDVYPTAYWAAIALFANPLLWFAPSRLAPETAAIFRRMVLLHRTHRHEILAGEIFPVGPQPDGKSITGFCSQRSGTGSGFVLVFRERQSESADAALALPTGTPETATLTRLDDLGGPCEATISGRTLHVRMPETATFALFRYTDA